MYTADSVGDLGSVWYSQGPPARWWRWCLWSRWPAWCRCWKTYKTTPRYSALWGSAACSTGTASCGQCQPGERSTKVNRSNKRERKKKMKDSGEGQRAQGKEWRRADREATDGSWSFIPRVPNKKVFLFFKLTLHCWKRTRKWAFHCFSTPVVHKACDKYNVCGKWLRVIFSVHFTTLAVRNISEIKKHCSIPKILQIATALHATDLGSWVFPGQVKRSGKLCITHKYPVFKHMAFFIST